LHFAMMVNIAPHGARLALRVVSITPFAPRASSVLPQPW
jgi:hypothetical protein